jgi:hypothetical protein
MKNLNRSMNGDIVVLQLLSESGIKIFEQYPLK